MTICHYLRQQSCRASNSHYVIQNGSTHWPRASALYTFPLVLLFVVDGLFRENLEHYKRRYLEMIHDKQSRWGSVQV